ncbi:MAG TPA: glycogen debranching protein GlgX [Spirochaetota bacterium]|nr:glycogen debranching protein GlgX [Spirochaetota bacterium]HPG52279.1 glycogen debranching protein GlgX [Spirochaetota bacterium]HPN14424.1 glycogen debranching protein GlgX [Spirochaetota bacterium]
MRKIIDVTTRFMWHVFVHGIGEGQLYAYRVRGEFNPGWGFRFNENRLLLDPCAKAFTGKCVNRDNLLLAYDAQSPWKDMTLDGRDSARAMPRCVVVSDDFDWQGDAPPDIPLDELIMYEVHVKGFTAHPSSGVKRPGTYTGFTEKIDHLRKLGVNAVELLPVHEYCVEDFLSDRGLTNYWGYNTIGFFAPESSYGTGTSPGCQVREFKTMVRELHRAGIEVILDVVFNHSAEGNELGPTVCFRGIDNRSYYLLTGPRDAPRRYYMNYTGCGNSMNLAAAPVIRLVLDSLRYWAEVMHVDGFRFDLASVLGREEGSFRAGASFFDAISQDPVLHRVKLIAEPWDISTYQAGNFPVDWSEWNGRFRDTVRRFCKGDPGQLRDLGWRLTGSADQYADDGRTPYNSINFVTCHDGFTLNDLVSYNGKHNEANLENNTDGSNDNSSWNCGWEGDSTDPEVLSLRSRQAKNFFSMLLFAQGTPMILGGDEFLRTQNGNNNAYCQDNAISWFDWDRAARNRDMQEFVRKAIAFRKRHAILRCRKFLTGSDADSDGMPDISWYGLNLDRPAWDYPDAHLICYLLDGGEVKSELGDYALFVIINADYSPREVLLPPGAAAPWKRVVDTSLPAGSDFCGPGEEVAIHPPDRYIANPRSTVVLIAR